jgi:CHAT domain-containing protein
VLPLLAALVLAPPQDVEPAPPSPFDRVIELELTADDPALIDGRGPTAIAEYPVEFEGTLHVWTRSELDLFLQIDNLLDASSLALDDDSGGGTTPYVPLEVQKGDQLAILVAGDYGVTGSLTLHLIAAPETEVTRAATATVKGALLEGARLVIQGDRSGARELAAAAATEVASTAGARDSRLLTDSCHALALSMHRTGDIAAARVLYEEVLAVYERTLPEDHVNLVRVRNNLAASMNEMGDLAGARALRETVLAVCERSRPEDDAYLLTARTNAANSMDDMGDSAGARALRETVLTAYERIRPEDHPDLLRARHNLAISMSQMGDLAGARALKEAVLAGYERTLPKDHPDRLGARFSLTKTVHEMGDLVGARALSEAMVVAYERTLPEEHPNLLKARNNLAASMRDMGDLAGARALHETVLAGCERTLPEDHPHLLLARDSLANLKRDMGDLAGARALYETVLAGYERTRPEGHPDLLGAQAHMAASMRDMGDLAGARALRETVLAGYGRILPEGHPDLLLAQANLANLMHAMGDLAGARALMPPLAAGMRARALASLALAPRQALGTVAGEEHRLSGVVLLSESGESSLKEAVFELTETLRLVAREAARSLARHEADRELAPILAEVASVRSSLNDLVAGAAREATGADELAEELTRLTLERDRLEGEASRLLAERGIVARAVETGAIAASLGPGEVAVGFRRLEPWNGLEPGEERVIAHVLTSSGALARVDLGPAVELEELAGAWRASLGAPLLRGVGLADEADTEVEVGRALRERLLDPVLAAAGEEATRLYSCADDFLFLLPLDALPLDEEREVERLGERVQIVNEVSFARLLAPAPAPATEAVPSLLALGGVDYDAPGSAPDGLTTASAPIEMAAGGGTERPAGQETSTRSGLPDHFQKLLQTRYEAEATGGLFEEAFELEPLLLTREEATKAALFEVAPGVRYLHVATHGWFAPESVKSIRDQPASDVSFSRMSLGERITGLAPMTLCGLALAGANNGRDSLGRVPGILTAEELCSLDLSQCELAVLSACETNVGIRRAGQGIQSLQAALYAAGARTSITSLWKVDDAATRRLFELFYTKLWKEKLGKADALWQAKMALRSEGHPVRDWAGWVLTGDPE